MLLIGGPGNEVVEESRDTIDAQCQALAEGTIAAVMIPAGSFYIPLAPKGIETLEITDDVPGAGWWLFDPEKINAERIIAAATTGAHGILLGHVQNKQELHYLTLLGGACDVVQAVNSAGVVIQDSLIERGNQLIREQQIAVMQARHPKGQIRVVSEQSAIKPRLAEIRRQCLTRWKKASS